MGYPTSSPAYTETPAGYAGAAPGYTSAPAGNTGSAGYQPRPQAYHEEYQKPQPQVAISMKLLVLFFSTSLLVQWTRLELQNCSLPASQCQIVLCLPCMTAPVGRLASMNECRDKMHQLLFRGNPKTQHRQDCGHSMECMLTLFLSQSSS